LNDGFTFHSTQNEGSFLSSPLASSEKSKPKTTKAVIRQELLDTVMQKKQSQVWFLEPTRSSLTVVNNETGAIADTTDRVNML